MASPDLIIRPFAESGEKQAPPQSDPNGFVNFSQGYTEDYEVDLNSGLTTAKAVERDIQNYLFHLLTGAVQAWQQMSISPWYAEMPGGYSAGAVVGRPNSSGAWQIWRSTADNNVADPIASGQTSWEYVPFNSEIVKSVAMPAGGTALIVPGGTRTEVVTVAADFNSFINGTWEFQTDTIANSSANSPVQLGVASALAGMLESKRWLNGATSYTVQRYVDRSGNSFYRGATNAVWTKWTSITQVNNFSVDTSAVANLVQGNALLSSLTLSNNQSFWVQIANANTDATNFSPNPSIAPRPVVSLTGAPLSGLELVSGGRALFTYNKPSDLWNLITCTLAPASVSPAKKVAQIPNVNQLIDMSTDTSLVANIVRGAGQLYGNPPAPVDGQKWTIRVATSNTGAVTISPNPAAPLRDLVGANNTPLQGGELIVGNEIVVMYRESGTRYILLENQGGARQIAPATNTNQAMNLGQANGRLINVIPFPVSGTYTKTSDLVKNIRVRLWAGGGATGGGTASTSTGCGGASGGGYCEGYFSAPAGPTAVVVGMGGLAASGAAKGGDGGASSFGSLLSATGGAGAQYNVANGPPGNGFGGYLQVIGGQGRGVLVPTAGGVAIGGMGGGAHCSSSAAIGTGGGERGMFPGGGASGAIGPNTGGNGGNGTCIVEEFS
ncbi:tail protein [Xanthomonas phage XcP1]|uniref:Tail fiber protein n=1 Tax=Xanthomonas phage XcP1 TaxID=2785027 RepID=A0A3S7L8K2_9CAUD|nr:tail protein [Xanthomonas phage XcP1]AWN08532.1 tail fiber protein [Xanthomonas phage XcP1]